MLRTLAMLAMSAAVMFAASSVHEFTLKSIEGKASPLADYKGKVVLLVNVASKCGFTPQYTGLEKLYEQYKDKGFVIIGIPRKQLRRPGARHQRRDQDFL